MLFVIPNRKDNKLTSYLIQFTYDLIENSRKL